MNQYISESFSGKHSKPDQTWNLGFKLFFVFLDLKPQKKSKKQSKAQDDDEDDEESEDEAVQLQENNLDESGDEEDDADSPDGGESDYEEAGSKK